MTKKPKVIIIGGGISGLACAYKLAKTKRFDVHIHEKDEILGGRLFDIFAGRVILKEKFHTQAIWFTKELGLTKELDEITPADLGMLLPNGKIISGKSMKFYLLKEFIFRRRNFKLFSEAFKFIRYAQSLEFNVDEYESNLKNKQELRNISFEEFRLNYPLEIRQFILDPVQMMTFPENFKKINAETGLYFTWVIYAMKKGYFMSRAPKIYADAFIKAAKELNINIHLNSEVKKAEKGNKVIFSNNHSEDADIIVCACPLNVSEQILGKKFGIEYSLMRAFLIKGNFRYRYHLSLSAFPESNIDLIYNWGEHQVYYPLNNWLEPKSQNKTPIELNIDYLYKKGEWEFIREIKSSVGIPLVLGREIPSLKQGENVYICGDFYGYPGLESAVNSGLKAAEEIMAIF